MEVFISGIALADRFHAPLEKNMATFTDLHILGALFIVNGAGILSNLLYLKSRTDESPSSVSMFIIYLITHTITEGSEFGKKAEKTYVSVQLRV